MKTPKWLKPMVEKQIEKLTKEIDRLYKDADKIQDRAWAMQDAAKKLRHRRFYLQTGHKVESEFEYKNKIYKILSTKRVSNAEHYSARVAPYLTEFLTGVSTSPFKLIPPKAK